MALCAECGSTISKVPAWLSDVKVTFVCETCRNRHPRQWASPEADLLAEEDEVEAKEPIEVGLEALEVGTGDTDDDDEEGFGGLELEPENE
ncbi:MAG: hypothetical protein HUU60_06575 [Armatimonadetes bacterium]|nr:hypothetical protein [Armatimonadota bacterium]